jgi:hypothetical protein
VALPDVVIDALKRRAIRQREDRLHAGKLWRGADYTGGKPTGFVFTSAWGMVMDPRNTNRAFDRIRIMAGLDAHTFHGLRHDLQVCSLRRVYLAGWSWR